jgi:hypothetical protein
LASPHLLLPIPILWLPILRLQTAAASLSSSTAIFVFNYTFNVERFTTYRLYFLACPSGCVEIRQLLPPEYPDFTSSKFRPA